MLVLEVPGEASVPSELAEIEPMGTDRLLPAVWPAGLLRTQVSELMEPVKEISPFAPWVGTLWAWAIPDAPKADKMATLMSSFFMFRLYAD
jgi:hypothetical protein